MKHVLKFTNPWGEKFFMQNLGNFWPGNVTRRLIERTTPDEAAARRFDTEEQAREVLATTGMPPGWDVAEVEE